MLPLDFAHRVNSPLPPHMRGKLRWIIADLNRCDYSKAYAAADLVRAGAVESDLRSLSSDPSSWRDEEREPLEFIRQMTIAAPTIPDELFAKLRSRFGDQQVAAMVMLAAYGNFQDRLILGLNLPLEADGPFPPIDVRFEESAFQMAPYVPTDEKLPFSGQTGTGSVVSADPDWGAISYDELQSRLEHQRSRASRLPIPTWDEVKTRIPPAMAARPTRIVWNLVSAGYCPELAVPWITSTRTLWAESKPDRIFEESLFWIQTRSVECNYCMGHCEMLLGVAGLDPQEVADRTRRLAAADWSSFPPAEQRAYAYARKLSKTPWELTAADYRLLESDLGRDKAMATFWWLCRGLYMTRISDGFQLPLERENVFQSVPNTTSAPDEK